MSEEQYGGPVIQIQGNLSARQKGCQHCDDLRVLFREKITKISYDFNQMLTKATEIQKQSSANHDQLVLTLGALKVFANDCIMVAKEGELGDPPPPAPSFMMPNQAKMIPESTWDPIPAPDIEYLSKELLEDQLEKMAGKMFSSKPAKNFIFMGSPNIIKSNSVPCNMCDGGYVGFPGGNHKCEVCNGSGMVDPKMIKKKPKKESMPVSKEVLCQWCGFTSKIIGGSMSACPKCKKLLP